MTILEHLRFWYRHSSDLYDDSLELLKLNKKRETILTDRAEIIFVKDLENSITTNIAVSITFP